METTSIVGSIIWMVWLGLILLSLILLAYEFRRQGESSRRIWFIWGMVTLLFGPLGLLGFWVARGNWRRRIIEFSAVMGGFVVVSATVIYVSRDWLGTGIRDKLDTQLAKRGYHLSYDTDEFNLLRGLILRNATLYHTEERQAPQLTLSEVAVSYNLGELLFSDGGRSAALTTDKATLTAFHEGEPYRLSKLTSTLTISPNGFEIRRLDGLFSGLRLLASGRLTFEDSAGPQQERADPEPGTANLDFLALANFSKALQIEAQETPPVLELNFSAPRGEPPNFSGRFEGRSLVWRGIPVDSLSFDFKRAEPHPLVLGFSGLNLEYQDHVLTARGRFHPETQMLELEAFESEVDLLALVALFTGSDPSEPPPFAFQVPPRIRAGGTIDFKDPAASRLTGDITLPEQVELPVSEGRTLNLNGLSAAFSLENGLLEIPDLAFSAFDGEAKGNAKLASEIGAEPMVIDFAPFELAYRGKKLTASGQLDPSAKLLQIARLDSKIDVIALNQALTGAAPPENIRFATPPHLVLSQASVPLDTPEDTSAQGTASGSMTVLFPGGQPLELQDIKSSFNLQKGSLRLSQFSASTLGGSVTTTASFSLFANPMRFDGTVKASGLSMDRISLLTGGQPREQKGQVSGNFTGSGPVSLKGLNGNGTVQVTGASFVSIPIFRGLRPLLAALTLTPWEGRADSSTLNMSYTLNGGIMTSEDILLEGPFFIVNGAARIDFNQDQLVAKAQANTRGATSLITELAGTVLAMEASGAFGDLTWKLTNVPGIGNISSVGQLSRNALITALGAASLPGGALLGAEKATEGTAKAAGKAAQAAGKAISGIGSALAGKKSGEDEEKPEETSGMDEETKKKQPEEDPENRKDRSGGREQ